MGLLIPDIYKLTGRRAVLCLYAPLEEEHDYFSAAKEFLVKELHFDKVNIFMANDEKRYDPENRAEKSQA